jgi:hypothetical protein
MYLEISKYIQDSIYYIFIYLLIYIDQYIDTHYFIEK